MILHARPNQGTEYSVVGGGILYWWRRNLSVAEAEAEAEAEAKREVGKNDEEVQ